MSWRRVALVGVALLLTGCQPSLDALAPPARTASEVEVLDRAPPARSAGVARVGVPAEPAGGLPLDDLDVAGGDLAALWGLPLYRADPHGQLVPALVETASVAADGRTVRLTLRPGRWSDGEAVTAHDLAASVEAVRAHAPDAGPAWLDEVEVVDSSTVRLHLVEPTRRWPSLLGATGVLPAHVLAEVGMSELPNPPEVVGGRYVPTGTEPGLERAFEAHPDGPLGPPSLERLEVVVVPSFDTGLGLVGHGDLDALMGHLAIRPELRVEALDDEGDWEVAGEDLRVAAPTGGTRVVLVLHPDGALAGDEDRQRAVRRAIDVAQQVEGLGLGTASGDPLGQEGDGDASLDGLELALVAGSEQEAVVATARLLEAQIRGKGGRLTVEGEPTPLDVRRAADLDAALVVRRGPTGHGQPGGEVVLYEARVAHVWHAGLEGVVASAGPGTGLSSAHRWSWAAAD